MRHCVQGWLGRTGTPTLRQKATRRRRGRKQLTVQSLERRDLLAANLLADFSGVGGIADADGFTSSGPADLWHLSDGRAADLGHSPDHSFYFGAGEGPDGGGLYTNFADGTLTSPPVDLTRAASAKLLFNTFLETERNFDFATVRVVDSLGTSTLIATSGAEMPVRTNGFEPIELDLSPFVGDTIRIEFQLTTDISVLREGWYIDDVVVNSSSNRTWSPQGPFSATNGQVEAIAPNGQIVGAIHTVLAHPTDADILYIGATNGGVWRTDNATAATPNWTPLTDDLPSLSIGAMAFDTADPTFQTIYVGTGRYSSFGRRGNDRVGIYKTTDGGASWTVLDDNLAGGNISGIAADGDNVVASVNVADGGGFNNTGIFRSDDAGATFTRVSTGDGTATGLPSGFSYDLVVDPVNPNVMYTSVVFGDNSGGLNGAYRSIDFGASWTKVSSPEMDALIISGETTNLEMAVGTQNNVYAAIINFGDMKGLFRSGDGGQTWVQMDSPKTNENGTDVGLNPRGQKGPGPLDNATPEELAGGQGSIHFSIVADPNNPNLVYVGGDRQPRSDGDAGSFPNSIGARDFSGRLFRGDASLPAGTQFVHLTHSSSLGAAGGGTASGSSPHADSREMTFDAAGNLIETDDGGVYRRTSPQDNTGDWFGVIGNLQVTESHNVAYDNLSDTIMSGNQDTGSTYQTIVDGAPWVSLSTADGGDIAIDNVSLAANNQSVRYSSFQNLGAFRKTTWDASGNLVNQRFPSLAGFNNDGVFVTPLAINAIDPMRLVIQGGSQTYETFDQAETVVGLVEGPNGGSTQSALAYGGRKDGVDNADVLWVGSDDDIFVRTNGTDPLALTAADPTGQDIIDLAIDPEDWASAFVIDTNSVFTTTDVGASWNDVTGDLLSLASRFFSVTYVSSAVVDAVLVGTNAGVFASLSDSLGTWELVGLGLPNVITFDMDYDAVDDVLVAGTLGRGSWLLDKVTELLSATEGVTNVMLDASGNLLVTDDSGNFAENITIASDTENQLFVITGVDQIVTSNIPTAVGSGTDRVTVPFADVIGSEIIVNSLGGNDSITIDFAPGEFDKSITVNGGDPATSDTLRMVGGQFTEATYDFVDSSNGNISLAGGPAIAYSDTSSVVSTLVHDRLLLRYSDATETITPSGNNAGELLIGSSFGASVSVLIPAVQLTIDGGQVGSDTINFRGTIDLAGADLNVVGDEVTLDGATLSTTGDGNLSIIADRNFFASKNAGLSTQNGDITVVGNRTADAAAGDFSGIELQQTVVTSITGDIRLDGRGGDEVDGQGNAGVRIAADSQVTSTGFGPSAGTLTIAGTGGDGARINAGVEIADAGTRISSIDGDIAITGTGGIGTEDFNHGIRLVGGTVESTGTGIEAAKITINGAAGNGVSFNWGTLIQGVDAHVQSVVGDITITGTASGTGDSNSGVVFNDGSSVSSTGTGSAAAEIVVRGVGTDTALSGRGIQFSGTPASIQTVDGVVQLFGTAGNATSQSNEGVLMLSGSILSSGNGDILVTGRGSGQGGTGIGLQNGAIIEATDRANIRLDGQGALDTDNDVIVGVDATIGSATGTGRLDIIADVIDISAANSINGAGNLNLTSQTSGATIGLGGGVGTLSLDDTELAKLADGFALITIGNATSGAVDIDSAAFTDAITITGQSIHINVLDAVDNPVTLRATTGPITNSSAGVDIIGGDVTLSGNITPGSSPGVLDIDGRLILTNDSSVGLELEGLVAGTAVDQHDQIRASQGVTFGARVSLATASTTGFFPIAGDQFVVLDLAGTESIVGTFAGLAEGALLSNFLGSGMTAVVSYTGGDGNDLVISVLPNVTLAIDQTSISEAGGIANVSATIANPVSADVVIDLRFTGSASNPADYVLSGTQILIPAGEVTASVVVTAIDDGLVESNETLVVDIVGVTGGGLLGIQQVVAVIADDDFVQPVITSTVANPTRLSTVPTTVDFGQSVTGFTQSDLVLAGAAVSDFTDLGSGRYSFNLNPTADGVVSVNIRSGAALDSGNKVTLPSNLFSLIVDRVPPTPIISGPSLRTNLNPIDVTVDFGQPVIGFDSSDVTLVGATIGQMTDNGNGRFTLTVDIVSDGLVSIDVAADVATDLAGNPNRVATPYSVTYDATPPTPVVAGPNSPNRTNPFEVSVVFGEPVTNLTTNDLAVTGGTVLDLVDDGDGNFTATVLATNDGDVTVAVPAAVTTDLTGNANVASSTFILLVDTTPPQPLLSSAEAITNADPFTVSIAFGEPVNGFDASDISVVGGSVALLESLGGGNYTATIDADADGIIVINVPGAASTDDAGNESLASASISVTVDTTPPTPVITGPAGPIGDPTFTVTVQMGETVSGLAFPDFNVGNGRVTRIQNTGSGNFTVSVVALADGPVTVDLPAAAVVDGAGNPSNAAESFSIIVDTAGPDLSIPASISVEADQFDGAAGDGEAIAAFLSAAIATDVVDTNPTITHNAPEVFFLGDTMVTFTATDSLGNTTSQAAIVTVVDTTAPTLTLVDGPAIEADSRDGLTPSNVVLQQRLRSTSATDIADRQVTLTNDVTETLSIGDNTVTFTATDDAGNVTVGSIVVTVVDTESPTVFAPAGISIEGNVIGGVDATDAQITDLIALATTTDIVDATPTLANDAPTIFPVGDTVITFTATDQSGNIGTSTTTVTVTDTTAPTLTPPTDTTIEADAVGGLATDGEALSTFLNSIGVTDIVDPSPTLTHDADGVLSLGVHTVTFTATDAAGNIATADITISIVDTTAPILTAPSTVTATAANVDGVDASEATIADFLSQALATDVVDADITIVSDAPTVFPIGSTLVTFTAIDDAGNRSTATGSVNVTASFDFGDAPTAAGSGLAASYPVTLEQDGARHITGPLFLGTSVDAEPDGLASTGLDAAGDDDSGEDDEGGIIFNASIVTEQATDTTTSLIVTSSLDAVLDGWIDFNRDGDWDDPAEQIVTSTSVIAGRNVISFTVPAGSSIGSTAARFRISSLGGLSPIGAANDGEVEDYLISIIDGDQSTSVTAGTAGVNPIVRSDSSGATVRSESVTLFAVSSTSVDTLDVIGDDNDDVVTVDTSDGFAIPAGGIRLNGNNGFNRLSIVGEGGVFDATNEKLTIENFGTFDLADELPSTLKIDAAAVARTAPTSRTLVVKADVSDTLEVLEANKWRLTGSEIIDGTFFLTADTTASGGDEYLKVSIARGWQNFLQPADINNDGEVTASDALRIINELGRRQFSDGVSQDLVDPGSVAEFPDVYFDHNGDNRATAIDALRVINQLARQANSDSSPADLELIPIRELIQRLETTSPRSADDPLAVSTGSDNGVVGEFGTRLGNGNPTAEPTGMDNESASSEASEDAVDQLLSDNAFLSSMFG
ncbi:Bacillopeptidase F precursor [Rubripirellula tenax]|uniref:Bacillopeptidase F n=1 Tax=Rubripirellula tenax TaxID=2528015 RepID=A0A5C6F7V2_9BACT|nr:Ig-like domain-containing protein [Rubripirellula tenax]TWU57052.1 Bacillopeptidase F precursor [Rubripirellula tenax]